MSMRDYQFPFLVTIIIAAVACLLFALPIPIAIVSDKSVPLSTSEMYYAGLPGPDGVSPTFERSSDLKRDIESSHVQQSHRSTQGDSVSTELRLTESFSGIDAPVDSLARKYSPDVGIAAGPTSLVIVANPYRAIVDKEGHLIASSGQYFIKGGDPKVLYDPESRRFFIAGISGEADRCTVGTCKAYLYLYVSKNSSPSTLGPNDWYEYVLDATLEGTTPTTNKADFTALGVNRDAVVISAIMVDINLDRVTPFTKVRMLNKSKLIRGEPVGWTDFIGMKDPVDGGLDHGFRPALHFDSSNTFFLVAISISNPCQLVVWGIDNTLSEPTLSARATQTSGRCAPPPAAFQPGDTSLRINVGSNGLMSDLIYRNGSLWMPRGIAQNWGSGDVAAIRWFQIDVSSWPNPVNVVQDSTFGSDGVSYFFPALTVDDQNNLVMVYGRGSSLEFASIYFTGRLYSDPLNTLRSGELIKAGRASFVELLPGNSTTTYGDYFGAAIDPIDKSFWLHAQYVRVPEAWGTWVGKIAVNISVSVSGRVMTPDGRGLRSATVSITDSNNVKRTTTTSSFGFYSFDAVQTGQTYTIAVSSRSYRFASRVVSVAGNLTDIDFVGLE